MDKAKLTLAIHDLIGAMDGAVAGISAASVKVQKSCYKTLLDALLRLDVKGGRFDPQQDFAASVLKAEKRLREITRSGLSGSVRDYLGAFSDIETRNVSMQKTFNDLEVDVEKLTPARKYVMDQATSYLSGAGLAERYIQPAKYLLMQQVVTGASVTEAQKMLEKWDRGELSDGKMTGGRQTPNLQRYATQMARDTAYQYNGTVQDIIRKEYDLEGFFYTGDVIADSRPLCKHLMHAEQPVKFEDLAKLLAQYPQGVIPGTTAANFQVYRGGYNCRHVAYPVRLK